MNTLRNALTQATQTAIRDAAELAPGPWRLRYHIEPQTGWLNDPNGLSYLAGWHHVFYQYCPFDATGGIKFWAHCRSRNLTDWEQLPVMLYSDEPFDVMGAYSGSALPSPEGLYMYYTGNVKYDDGDYDYILEGREQNTVLAYSRDGIHLDRKRLLMTNEDYPADMTRHVRDPKVFAYDGRFYMVLGARTRVDEGVALIYESDDRRNWHHINTLRTAEPFGYMWECPDLFEIDGQWFLMISPQGVHRDEPGYENIYTSGVMPLDGDFRGEYTLGAFQPLDFGFDFYAPQTYECDGRRLLIGWMGMPDADYTNPTVRFGYQQALTQVRELRRDGTRVLMEPVAELAALRENESSTFFRQSMWKEMPPAFELQVEAESPLEVEISGARFTLRDGMCELKMKENGSGRTVRRAPAPGATGARFLVDTSSIECFLNDGSTVFSTRFYPPAGRRSLSILGIARVTEWTLRPFGWQTVD